MNLEITAIEDFFADLRTSFLESQGQTKVTKREDLDLKTSFVYSLNTLGELKAHLESQAKITIEEKIYAENRWRKLRRHDAWLALLVQFWPKARLAKDPRDKSKDFSMQVNESWLDFDLKVTGYPKAAPADLDKQLLATWMFLNQSNRRRNQFSNTVFVVSNNEASLYDFNLASNKVAEVGSCLVEKLFEVALTEFDSTPKSIVLNI